VYRSAALVELVPPELLTVTSTVPKVPAGATAVSWLDDTTVTEVAATPPNATVEAAVKFEPVMVTKVPPVEGPLAGAMAVTTGVATRARQ
jgi:hypothetical protein